MAMKPQVSEREMQQVKAVFDAKHALLVDRETELSRSLEAFALERERAAAEVEADRRDRETERQRGEAVRTALWEAERERLRVRESQLTAELDQDRALIARLQTQSEEEREQSRDWQRQLQKALREAEQGKSRMAEDAADRRLIQERVVTVLRVLAEASADVTTLIHNARGSRLFHETQTVRWMFTSLRESEERECEYECLRSRQSLTE